MRLTDTFDRARHAIHEATADDSTSILRGAIAGAAAGLIASLVMDGVEKIFMSDKQDSQEGGKQPGHDEMSGRIPAYTPEAEGLTPRGDVQHNSQVGDSGRTATQKTATAVAQAAGVHLDKKQREAAGAAVHLGFGISVGAIYGALAEVAPVVTVGMGLPYGAAVWLLADETALSLLGLEDPPQERPLSTHAGSFGMHLVYGATLDLVRRGIRSLL